MELVTLDTEYAGPKLTGGHKTIIDEQNLEMFILKALENYSFPIQTLTQEYINNGKDSNREAGIPDHKMKIHVPTLNKPKLIIRDYGMGLDNDGIINVYRKLGTSTKGRGNDISSKLAGGYGAGAKIWIRYTDSCIIRAWKNGRKIEYLAHTANSRLGEYLLMGESDSDEPNGVEIEIALKELSDIRQFENAVRRMFLFWKEKPEINKTFKWPTVHFEDDSFIFCQEETLTKYSISVDGTIYPIPESYGALVQSKLLPKLKDVKCKLVFKSKITDVFVPMNREQVADDEKLLNFLKSQGDNLDKAKENYLNSILDKDFSTISDLRKAIRTAKDHLNVGTRKFNVSRIDRSIMYRDDDFTVEFKHNDKFHMYEFQNRDPKYKDTNKIAHHHVVLKLEQMSPNILRKIRKTIETESFNIWRDPTPEFVEFFGISTYEEICPKKTKDSGYSSGGYYGSYSKLTNSQVHYKTVKGHGYTLEVSSFLEKFPPGDIIVTELINNTADFEMADWIEKVSEVVSPHYKHVCISARTMRILKAVDDRYNFLPTTTVKVNDTVIKHIAMRNLDVPQMLKLMAEYKGTLPPDARKVRRLINEIESSPYISDDFLSKQERKKVDKLDTEYKSMIAALKLKYPILQLGKTHDNTEKTVRRKLIKWLFTNLELLLPSEEKTVPQNNLEDQTIVLN
jgi:hypothetical protein